MRYWQISHCNIGYNTMLYKTNTLKYTNYAVYICRHYKSILKRVCVSIQEIRDFNYKYSYRSLTIARLIIIILHVTAVREMGLYSWTTMMRTTFTDWRTWQLHDNLFACLLNYYLLHTKYLNTIIYVPGMTLNCIHTEWCPLASTFSLSLHAW